MGLLIDCLD